MDSRQRQLERANVVVQMPKPYPNEDSLRDAQEFAVDLRRWGLTVEVTAEQERRYSGISGFDWVAIFIGVSAGKKILERLVDDLYDAAKEFLLKRLRKTKRKQSFTLYGPEGDVLKQWNTDEDGEKRAP